MTPRPAPPVDDLRTLAARGVVWATVGQGGSIALHYVVTLLLAWRLGPADFGLIGLATIYIFIVCAVAELGVGAAIVQRPELTNGHIAAAFWASLGAGAALAPGVWLAAPSLAELMREPRLVGVLRALALMVPVHALLVVPRGLLQRSLCFGRLAATEIGAELTLGVVALGLAHRGYGAWSLVAGLLARHCVRAALLWYARPWRPTLRTTAEELRDVIRFGAFIMGSMLAAQIVANVDYFVVGRYLGAAALAYYTLAFQLAIIPVQRLGEILTRVAFPSLARIQADRARVRGAFTRMLEGPTALVAASAILLAVNAPTLIQWFYGEPWAPVVRPLQLLALAAPFYMLDCSQIAFRAIGRLRLDLGMEVGRVMLFAALVGAGGLLFGTVGVAGSLLLAAALTGTAKLLVARRIIGQHGLPGLLAVACLPMILVGVMLTTRSAHYFWAVGTLLVSLSLAARAFSVARMQVAATIGAREAINVLDLAKPRA